MSGEPSPVLAAPSAYSMNVDHALALAAIAHRPADRKGTRVPYVVHPMHVALILQRHGYPEPVQIAALLHDVLEDVEPSRDATRTRLAETFSDLDVGAEGDEAFKGALLAFIGRRFGSRVRELVHAMTQVKRRADGSAIPIGERRQATVERVTRSGDLEFVAVKAADALHNSRSIVNDLRAKGLPMMARFKGSPIETLEYYVALGRAVTEQLGAAHPLAHELGHAVHDLRTTLEEALHAGIERVQQIEDRPIG